MSRRRPLIALLTLVLVNCADDEGRTTTGFTSMASATNTTATTQSTTTSPTSTSGESTSGTGTGISSTSAATTSTTGGCVPGSEGCACDAGACAAPLVCEADVCVAPPPPSCGDGSVDAGEECDDANDVDSDACLNNCKAATCGDGVVHARVEACDDGNTDDGDGCSALCASESCGDGVVQANEECDDANMVDTDACTATCKNAKCGDGSVQMGVEECDDANMVETDACLATCKAASCGDGKVQAGVEECDDGNKVDNDGCTSTCKKGPTCGTFFTTWNGWSYYKVTVAGTLTDVNVRTACQNCGLKAPCQATDPCQFNDALCLQTSNETSCGNPMLGLAKQLCGGAATPANCAQLYNTYQYMGTKWTNAGSCGAKAGSWCVNGASQSNQSALCVLAK